jgi:hypothetical protein
MAALTAGSKVGMSVGPSGAMKADRKVDYLAVLLAEPTAGWLDDAKVVQWAVRWAGLLAAERADG